MSDLVKQLPTTLTADEYKSRAHRLAQIGRERIELKAAKATAAAGFNTKDKELADEASKLLKVVETGVEDRPIVCSEERDVEAGLVYFVRKDTKERVGHRAMTGHEKQLTVPGSDGGPPTKVVDSDGEIHKATPEQIDVLRIALSKGEPGVKLDLPDVGERWCVAIDGEKARNSSKQVKRRRRKGGEEPVDAEVDAAVEEMMNERRGDAPVSEEDEPELH
jgi:hypothetical protein